MPQRKDRHKKNREEIIFPKKTAKFYTPNIYGDTNIYRCYREKHFLVT
jgi:hypothetical protein